MKTADFLLSHMLGDEWSGLRHLRDDSSLISVKIWSTGITNGVNFIGRGFLSSLLLFPSSFRRSAQSLFCPLRSSSFSFFFSLVLSTPSMAAKASSAFMYFCAFNNASTIVLGGFLAKKATNLWTPILPWRSLVAPYHLFHPLPTFPEWSVLHWISRSPSLLV